MRRGGGAPAGLLLVAVVCAGLLVWPAVGRGDDAAGWRSSDTPVLSLRRVPALLAQLVAGARLHDDLDRAFAGGVAPPPAPGRACLVVHDGGGNVLYARAPDVGLAPASTVKLLTAAAVLSHIPADARFVTEVRASAPARNGVVDGDLWLVGGGDPLLGTNEFAAHAGLAGGALPVSKLEDLADRIVGAGVREIRGGLLGDESRYDAERYVSTWKPEYVAQGQSGPLSALTVNRGFTRLRPTPAPAAAPAAYAVRTLAALLAARGVRVGSTGEGASPPGAVVVTALESLPVGRLVAEMLQESDNTTAELLTKELGFRSTGTGSTVAGVEVIRATAAALGPGLDDGVVLLDGSGLDRANRATCNALTALLDSDAAKATLRAALPVAARSGTLAERFVGTAASGRIRAKTGSLDDVAALSGYARDAGDQDLTFTMLVNDSRADAARLLLDRVGLVLIGYPSSPPPSELGPR